MKYDSRMGIAYDTLFYSVFYFNFDRIKKDYQEHYGVTEKDFSFYYRLKESISTPPPELYPFFYWDLLRPSFLSNRYYHDFRFGQEDFLSFLSRIEIDPSLRQSVFEYYVGPLNETSTLDNMELIKQILKMDADRELILQLINLSASFESVLQTLFSFLKKIYLLVEDLHVQNKAHVQKLLKIYDTDNFLMNLHMLGAFEYEHESKKDRDSISLLNAAIILQKGTYETGYKFVFGGKCSAQLDKSMIDFQISSRELCEALGNPIKYDILMYLKDTEATATQLTDVLILSRQTVNRHLLWLFRNWFIFVSKRKGPEGYYQINRHFFTYAKRALYEFAENFENDSAENKESEENENVEKTDN